MRANLANSLVIGLITACSGAATDGLQQQLAMTALDASSADGAVTDGAVTDGAAGDGPGGDPVSKIELDPLQIPPLFDVYPDDSFQCLASTALAMFLGDPSPTCGQCDVDELGQVVDPYCDSYGAPDSGSSSICNGALGTELVSCLGPSEETPKTYLLPSEHTARIREVFYAYPVDGTRSVFATLPAASSDLLPAPTGARPRISQAAIRRFILRSMTAATGKRTQDNSARDHAETDLVQVTVVTNNVETARSHIIAHLKGTRAAGGLALTQEQAEAMVGPATEAAYRGAGKIRLVSVTGLRTVWVRDFGPHILQLRAGGTKNAEQVIMDFGYHGDRPSDDAVPSRLYALRATLWPGATMSYIDANRGNAQIRTGNPLAATNWTADGTAGPTNGLKDEGGNLSSDGYGSCLTTWKNLAPTGPAQGDAGGFTRYFAPNGSMTAADQRTRLHQLLGCDHVTVLPRLPYDYNETTEVGTGDGTGHVDMLTHYYGRDKILLAESQKGDANCDDYPKDYIGQFNKRTCLALAAAKTELRRVGYLEADIKRVPMLDYTEGLRSARSTTNLLEVGNRVLYVTYDSMTDAQKTSLRDTLAAAYGGTRQLVELDASAIIQIGGAVHCTAIGFQDL